MRFVVHLLITAVCVLIAATIIPGVHVNGISTALLVAVVWGTINMFVKPVLVLLTLPLTIVTLGLFYVVLNILLVLATAWVVPGFSISGLLPALLFSITISLVGSVLHRVVD